jgi:hypothetical protein
MDEINLRETGAVGGRRRKFAHLFCLWSSRQRSSSFSRTATPFLTSVWTCGTANRDRLVSLLGLRWLGNSYAFNQVIQSPPDCWGSKKVWRQRQRFWRGSVLLRGCSRRSRSRSLSLGTRVSAQANGSSAAFVRLCVTKAEGPAGPARSISHEEP